MVHSVDENSVDPYLLAVLDLLFFRVPKIATVRLAVEVLHNKALTPGQVGS